MSNSFKMLSEDIIIAFVFLPFSFVFQSEHHRLLATKSVFKLQATENVSLGDFTKARREDHQHSSPSHSQPHQTGHKYIGQAVKDLERCLKERHLQHQQQGFTNHPPPHAYCYQSSSFNKQNTTNSLQIVY